MAYATVSRIQRIGSYQEAEQLYDSIKPIRGSNIRPIGARRNAHWYQLTRTARLEGGYDYHARLYDTNVVTFYPDNTIQITHGGYATATTMQFIEQVLHVGAYRTRGQSVIKVDGQNHVLAGKDGVLILENTPKGYRVKQSQRHKQWVINRTATNNVRRRTSEFRAYLKGFINLRHYMEPDSMGDMHKRVMVTTEEIVQVLGTYQSDNLFRGKVQVVDKRKFANALEKGHPGYISSCTYLYNLMRNDQPDEGKVDNFYKATLSLLYLPRAQYESGIGDLTEWHFYVGEAEQMLDEMLFKFFSDEVLVLKDVPEGKVPSTKYDSWVNEKGLRVPLVYTL